MESIRRRWKPGPKVSFVKTFGNTYLTMEYRHDLLKLFDSNISEAEAICTMVMLINNIICKKIVQIAVVIGTTEKIYNLV